MSQRDDESYTDVETRLRAAFMARSEQVTHQSLRPGVVPGTRAAQDAMAAAASKPKSRFSWNLSWRGLLVPSMVTASLVVGVGIGVVLPDGGSGGSGGAVAAGSGGTGSSRPTPSSVSDVQPSGAAPDATAPALQSFAGLQFQLQDWKLTKINDATACLLPPGHADVNQSSKLPCGADSLMLKTDATAAAWPLSAVKDKAGWWPVKTTTLDAIPCPTGGLTSGAKLAGAATTSAGGLTSGTPTAASVPAATVKTSAVFRADADYPLDGTTKASYVEWSTTCSDGTGVTPMLWHIGTGTGTGTTTGSDSKVVVTAVSATRHNDRALLAIVASMRPVAS